LVGADRGPEAVQGVNSGPFHFFVVCILTACCAVQSMGRQDGAVLCIGCDASGGLLVMCGPCAQPAEGDCCGNNEQGLGHGAVLAAHEASQGSGCGCVDVPVGTSATARLCASGGLDAARAVFAAATVEAAWAALRPDAGRRPGDADRRDLHGRSAAARSPIRTL